MLRPGKFVGRWRTLDSADRVLAIKFEKPWAHDSLTPGGRPMALTDLGNSERLVLAHGDDLRHIQISKQWLVWDGRRFSVDSTGEVKRRTKLTMKNILFEAAAQDDEEQRKQLVTHQIRSESDRAIRAAMSLAESDERIARRISDFDKDPLILTVLNGTINLNTCELGEHSRADYATKMSPVEFDRDATAPTWKKFLHEIMDGDLERIRFLQRALGYSLTGDANEHCFFLLFGIGANGKSTVLETCRFLLGDYAAQADFGTFLASKAGAIRNDLARLAGARFVSATESDAGKRMAEPIIKHLTGGDTLAARYLYSEHFEFRPQFKLWLATNHKPKIIGTDEAIWRRVKLIPFTVTIAPEKRDHRLSEKLKAEAPGILNWALAGLRDWRANGLAEPKTVRDATSEYRQHEDALAHFLDAKVTADPNSELGKSEFYRAYKDWTDSTGEFRMNEREFSAALRERGFVYYRTNAGRYWKGVKLSP